MIVFAFIACWFATRYVCEGNIIEGFFVGIGLLFLAWLALGAVLAVLPG